MARRKNFEVENTGGKKGVSNKRRQWKLYRDETKYGKKGHFYTKGAEGGSSNMGP